MVHDDIEDMLDHLRMIKSGGDLNFDKIDQIETLEIELRFLRTFFKYHHVLLTDSFKITKKVQLIRKLLQSVFCGDTNECKANLNVERLVTQLLNFVEGNTSSMYNFELNGSYLSEYMDYLDKNLNDTPRYLVRSDPFFMKEIQIDQKTKRFLKQVKIIQKKMGFLRYIYATEINVYIDHEKLEGLETLIQFMADNVRQFCLALWDKDEYHTDSHEMGDDTTDIKIKPPYLLCLIELVRLEMQKIFLSELKDSKFSKSRTFKNQNLPKDFAVHLCSLLVYLQNKKLKNFPADVSDQNIVVAMDFLLVFLADVPNCVINGKCFNEVLGKVGALVSDIVFVIQKLLLSSIIEDQTEKYNLCTRETLEKIQNLKAEMEERYYKSVEFAPHQFPTVGGLSFLDSLKKKLNEMLKSESSLNFMVKPHVAIVEKALSSLTSIFRDVRKVHHEHEILIDLQKRSINLAYEAEVAIDSILVQYNTLWYLFCSLPAITKEIKHITMEMTVMWSNNLAVTCSLVEPSKHLPNQQINLVNNEAIVGFENDISKIIQHLIQGTKELDVIPIVGMGGQGKTTCARKLYHSDNIVSHFDVRAWCVISQTYYRRRILQEIFSQVTGSKGIVGEDNVLADMLRKRLMGKRYLIVIDDMWDGNAWNDIRLSFPDDKNGSRIIVTTRLEEVGKQVKYHTDPYSLPFLTAKESCELLQQKVFRKEGCPDELQEVCLAVAARCKGLPLAVILVAGLIETNKMEASWWHEVGIALFSYLAKSDQDYSLATMQLSYDNLSDHIRPCLLYMGMFPEDSTIQVSKLISLWIAEGFVQNVESWRLEEEAEGYLMDLISRNLVMVSERGYNGKVKYCQLHDIVLHFCLEKSRKEKFISVVDGNYKQFKPLAWKENRVNFQLLHEFFEFSTMSGKTPKPLHQHSLSFKTQKPLHHLRSVLTNFESYTGETYPLPLHHISRLRLLKVLDLSVFKMTQLTSSIFHPLIHLKYLALSTSYFDLKPEFCMRHLETLIVHGLHYRAVLLQTTFWKMEKLRLVEMLCYPQLFQESVKLENLKILRNVELFINEAAFVDALSRRCPNLQELKILYGSVVGPTIVCPNFYVKLDDFTQLRLLELIIHGRITEVYLPLNLKELILEMHDITRRVVSMIVKLRSLEYLDLRIDVYEEQELFLRDVKFYKLKFLGLTYSNISRLDASEESFPHLETLALRKCHHLKEIPLSFAYIGTLKQIELINCNIALEASAVKVKEEIEEMEGSGDRLDIQVYEW